MLASYTSVDAQLTYNHIQLPFVSTHVIFGHRMHFYLSAMLLHVTNPTK
jgi:hypothetical protein